jgi:thiamine pyrophosphate-dependent acetolactate synthase large subunit-like protein
MQVAEAVGRALARRGPPHVFGLIGSGNFTVTNAMVAAGARFIAARHEGSAISMADAYAQETGQVGMCSVHQGPGLTNTMTGLTEAAKSRTPLVVLAGDTAAAAIRSNFRIDQDQLVTSVGAIAERIHGPQTAIADALRALRRARVERKPVVLMLPLDIQAADCLNPEATVVEPPVLRPARPSADAVAEAAAILSRAERPLILAGRGARDAGAAPQLESLAEVLGALLATSAVGNGLFASNPWCLGISGGFASPTAAELIAEADVVLGAGVSLNMWTTRHGKLLSPSATVIQLDHEFDAIGAHHRVDIAVVGDVAESAQALLSEIARRETSRSGWRSPEVAAQIANGRWQCTPFDDASTSTRIDPRALSNRLDQLLPLERNVAIDSGHFMGYPAMYLRVPDQRAFVFTQSFQAVGLGLASAIGTAIASPERLTVAALGDGGAMLSLPEFETVARLGLKMLIVVYNDSAYGAEVHHFGPHGDSLDLVRFPEVDFAALGRAAGLRAATIRSVDDLRAVPDWVASGCAPGLVLDAKVVPTVVAEWLEEAFRGH